MKKYFDKPFFYNASPEIIRRAKHLRSNMTDAEKALWERIRNNQLEGLRFRRQHPISRFIVDFYCHEKLLIVELDGEVHEKSEIAERDEGRQFELEQLGLKVVRFKNIDVLTNIEEVLLKIKEEVHPPLLGGG